MASRNTRRARATAALAIETSASGRPTRVQEAAALQMLMEFVNNPNLNEPEPQSAVDANVFGKSYQILRV